jgi:hypothetical protein
MSRCLPRLKRLSSRIGLGFEFVSELIELVEIDTRPEAECVRNGFRSRPPTCFCLHPETGAQRPIDYLLEGQPEFARAPLQEAGQIIVYGECGAHK